MTQTPKQYLASYLALSREIDAVLEERARLRSLAEKVCGGGLTDMPRAQQGKTAADFTRVIENIVLCENRANAKIDELVRLREEVELVLDTVEDDVLRVLLRYRYISGWTWERIAVQLNYSYMHICRLHGKALQAVRMA